MNSARIKLERMLVVRRRRANIFAVVVNLAAVGALIYWAWGD